MAKTPTKSQKAAKEAEERQRSLRAFYERRHPAYDELLPHWEFVDKCYKGGRSWFVGNIFQYFKEGPKEYEDRLKRAYRFNHTREVVELVKKYLFKGEIVRSQDAPEEVKEFWRRATRAGGGIDQLIQRGSTSNSTMGRCAVVIDNNFAKVDVEGEKRDLSIAEAEAGNFRIFGYTVSAKNILDYAFDEDGDGELLWIKLREVVRDDANPHTSTGEMVNRVRLWTRTGWELYEEVENRSSSSKDAKTNIQLKDEGFHNLGFVPVRLFDHVDGEDHYRAVGLVDDIAYLDRAVANYLSSLDAIIQDQTFSQLAIPAQSALPGEDAYKKLMEMGTKRVFTYDGGAGSTARPHFLAPDPKQAGVILSVISKIINEIYHTIGLAGERTKEDNAVGIDNSSGVAKAYDFERVNSLLLAKAASCQNVENWIANTVLAWHGKKPIKENLVTYPTTFDVMRLVDDLVTAEALAKLQAPAEVRRVQMRQAVAKMLPQADDATRQKLEASIDSWLEGENLQELPSLLTLNQKPVAAPDRQGEVTADTDQSTKAASQ